MTLRGFMVDINFTAATAHTHKMQRGEEIETIINRTVWQEVKKNAPK